MSFVGRRPRKRRIIFRVQTLKVDVGHTCYPIAIGPGLLRDRTLLDSVIRGRDLCLVSNTTVAALYLERLQTSLSGRRLTRCVLPDGEQYKTLQTLGQVFDALVQGKQNRDTTIVALGGGVIGDIAGFAAACYQRGVSYVQIPTTLLAQVDSSVGGKTGVNHPGGKNLIGAFHQPLGVIADTDTLATLPDRELRAGLAEVIKYGCVWDPLLFDWLDANIEKLTSRDGGALAHAIERSCAIKAAVVGRDERENDVRAILNFGHTFGHAIESATHYATYLHGEAVGLGMLMAANLSHRLGLIDREAEKRVHDILARTGLPVETPRIGAACAFELMRMDKKVLGGTVRLVLLEGVGRAVVTGNYAQSALNATLNEFFA
ncbi:MAG: 3-dehydroquinate synthase [Gammaproteobacteria bacterium]|nr:3-dehydroquinate synthase [Gammaproteobacteria bacterium]